jgi:hypothetical protein
MQAKKRIVLDWSRLLGFDQVRRRPAAAPGLADPRVAKLGVRIGAKPGLKA